MGLPTSSLYSPVPQDRYFSRALWTQNCAGIWDQYKCLRRRIGSIMSCSDTTFLVAVETPELYYSLHPLAGDSPEGWTWPTPAAHCDSGSFPFTLPHPYGGWAWAVLRFARPSLAGRMSRRHRQSQRYSSAIAPQSCCNILGGESGNNWSASLPEMCFYLRVCYFAGWCQSVILPVLQGKSQCLCLVRTFLYLLGN